jgi:hypothetical protein
VDGLADEELGYRRTLGALTDPPDQSGLRPATCNFLPKEAAAGDTGAWLGHAPLLRLKDVV